MPRNADNPFTMTARDFKHYNYYPITETLGCSLLHDKETKLYIVSRVKIRGDDQERDPIGVYRTFIEAKEELCFQLQFLKKLYYENDRNVFNFEYDHYE